MCSGELRNDQFPFRWDISVFLLTYLSLPREATWMPRDVILPSSAASPSSPFLPGSLSFGSRVQSHWPRLGLLSWPPWWVAMTCGFFLCLIPSVRLLPSPPIPGLSWTTAFVSWLAVSFLTPFCSRFNSHPPVAAVLDHSICLSTCCIFSDSLLFSVQLSSSSGCCPEAQGMPSVPCRWCWWICVAAHAQNSRAQPSPPPSRELLGWSPIIQPY